MVPTHHPTLEQFKQWVAEGKSTITLSVVAPVAEAVRERAAKIQSWVEENFTAETVDGVIMYDLSREELASLPR